MVNVWQCFETSELSVGNTHTHTHTLQDNNHSSLILCSCNLHKLFLPVTQCKMFYLYWAVHGREKGLSLKLLMLLYIVASTLLLLLKDRGSMTTLHCKFMAAYMGFILITMKLVKVYIHVRDTGQVVERMPLKIV